MEKNQMSRDWKPSCVWDFYLPNQKHIYISQFICCNTVDQICLDPLLLEFVLKIIGILVARNFTRNFKRSRNLENVPTKTSSWTFQRAMWQFACKNQTAIIMDAKVDHHQTCWLYRWKCGVSYCFVLNCVVFLCLPLSLLSSKDQPTICCP